MREILKSGLLSSLPGLHHGFLPSHQPGGRDALDKLEPSIATVKQVHGSTLLWTEEVEKRRREADALATSKPGLAVGVYSADCAPVLVAAYGGREPLGVMAVHGGWRGTAEKIAEKSFLEFAERMDALGAERYFAALGPCISFPSFEVGEEVVLAFPGSLERGLARFFREEEGKKKFLFDLPGENLRQLQESAVGTGRNLEMEWISLCTLQEKDSLPSFRRDGTKAGRILSFLSFER